MRRQHAQRKEAEESQAPAPNDDERTEQEKEFDRVLMGYYGG